MPRVKVAYVVSFSSEDPEHRAANLLAAEVSKKRWLCSKWEPSCSVVLQLERAVEISAVHIGAYHAALIEVLVGLSERPNDPFQVLVPSCVFLAPAEARRDVAQDRVRSFGADALSADTRGRRFDRVRVVCSQPYNKHCKYGISFIHIHEAEGREAPPAAPAAAVASAARAPAPAALPTRHGLFNMDAVSSDDDEFRPGELFAKHLKSPAASDSTANNTSAQIRQATSQALKNIRDSSTKLLKTPINTPSNNRPIHDDDGRPDRQRPALMYTDDDDKPHDKIDRVVNRHKEERSEDRQSNKTNNKDTKKDKESSNESSGHFKKHTGDVENSKRSKDTPPTARTPHSDGNKRRDSEGTPKQREGQKRPRDQKKEDNSASSRAGPVCSDLSAVLRGVTLALSGYAGARRAAVRDAALLLGARYSAHWTPHCTHLVCAFPNTPKLRAVRAGGGRAGVATAEWVEACLARRRRLPWQWFATLPAERLPQPPHRSPTPEPENSSPAQTFNEDEDTDDEIEKALSVKKKPRLSSPAPALAGGAGGAAGGSSDSDVTFVRDERFRGHVTLESADDDGDVTERDDRSPREERIDASKELPDFFDGYTFVISDDLREQRELLARYVRAYGGLVIQQADVQEDSEVHYVVSRGAAGAGAGAGAGGARAVSPRWVWRCHRERRRCSAA